MRISDWSSDVCSSDLGQGDDVRGGGVARNIVRRHLRKHRFADQPHAWRGRLRVGFDDPKLSLFGRERGQRRLRGGTGVGRRGEGPVARIDPQGERIPLGQRRSEEHTSELQSLMRISYAVFCLKKKKKT